MPMTTVLTMGRSLVFFMFCLNCGGGSPTPADIGEKNPATDSINMAARAIATAPDMTLNILADTRGRVHPHPLVAKSFALARADASGNAFTYRIAQGPAQGTAEIDGFTLTYAPDLGFDGSDLVSVLANNGVADFQEMTITFVNEAKPSAPRLLPDFAPTSSLFKAKPGTFSGMHGVGSASVAYDATRDRYVMAFESRYAAADADCTAGYWGIGTAISQDGAVWEQNDDMAVKPLDGTDDACIAAQPTLIHDGAKLHLFFKMHKKPNEQDGIGYSTSTDGKIFSAPVKITTGTKNSPTALKFGNRIYVYYSAKSGTRTVIAREWSGNGGKTWNPAGNITRDMLSVQGDWAVGTPFAIAGRFDALSLIYDANDADTPFKMLVVASITAGSANSTTNPASVGALLQSIDGENWQLSADIPVTPNPEWRRNPEILLDGNDYLLWYDVTDAEGKAEIRFMTTLALWPR